MRRCNYCGNIEKLDKHFQHRGERLFCNDKCWEGFQQYLKNLSDMADMGVFTGQEDMLKELMDHSYYTEED